MTFAVDIAGVGGGVTSLGIGSWFLRHWYRRRHYASTLRNIARLERELGIGRPASYLEMVAEGRSPSYTDVMRSPYSLSGRDVPYVAIPLDPLNHGYQGPAMTNEDVRRAEHPQEFT